MFRKQLACLAGVLLIAASASALDWNDPHSIVDAALAVSPALREIEANLAAARARQKGAGATPNPMLMAGVQNQQIDLSTDANMTMYMAGVSQTFVRRERRNVLQHEAGLAVEQLERESEARRAEVARDVLVAY